MNKSSEIGNLAKALCSVQSKLTPAIKDSANPFFKSKYADLNAVWGSCRSLLAENGLSVAQVNQAATDGVIIETVLMHESGEWISGEMFLPLTKNDAQGVGSAITYGRRYGLAAILGIVADEDDDGHAASHNRTAQKEQPKQQPKPADAPIGERIRKVEAALKELGIKEPPVQLSGRSPEELKEEFTALVDQYKRLSATKGEK